jgi:hypothetical protein
MKPDYMKVKIRRLGPEEDALQESVNGIVTRYLDADGNLIDANFAECNPVGEASAPSWAPDVAEPVAEEEHTDA